MKSLGKFFMYAAAAIVAAGSVLLGAPVPAHAETRETSKMITTGPEFNAKVKTLASGLENITAVKITTEDVRIKYPDSWVQIGTPIYHHHTTSSVGSADSFTQGGGPYNDGSDGMDSSSGCFTRSYTYTVKVRDHWVEPYDWFEACGGDIATGQPSNGNDCGRNNHGHIDGHWVYRTETRTAYKIGCGIPEGSLRGYAAVFAGFDAADGTLYIYAANGSPVYLNPDSSSMFKGMTGCREFDLSQAVTKYVTNGRDFFLGDHPDSIWTGGGFVQYAKDKILIPQTMEYDDAHTVIFAAPDGGHETSEPLANGAHHYKNIELFYNGNGADEMAVDGVGSLNPSGTWTKNDDENHKIAEGYQPGYILPENSFRRYGFTLAGWSEQRGNYEEVPDETSTNENYPDATVPGGTEKERIEAKGSGAFPLVKHTVLYAVWKHDTYTVHFNPQKNYYPDVKGSMADQTLLVGGRTPFEISLDGSEKVINESLVGSDGKMPDSAYSSPDPGNYHYQTLHGCSYTVDKQHFVGWADHPTDDPSQIIFPDARNGYAVIEDLGKKDDKVTLYAVFSPDVYNVTYDLRSGYYVNGGNPVQYKTTGDPVKLVNPVRTGYVFAGWNWKRYSNDEGNDTVQGNVLYNADTGKYEVPSGITADHPYLEEVTIPTGTTGTYVFYANWISDTAKITFDPNGGEPHAEPVEHPYYVPDDDGGMMPNPIGELPVPPIKPGYEFDGWYPNPEGKGTEVTSQTVPDADATYYAHWVPKKYTGTFNAGRGEI